MSELLFNCYDKKKYPKSFFYELNDNVIENFDLSSTSIPVVFCLNSGTEIYYADSSLQTTPYWTLIPGGLNSISVSNNQTFGVNSGGEVYYKSDYKSPYWNGLSEPTDILSQISFDGYANVVCGISKPIGTIYFADTNITTTPNWTKIPEGNLRLQYISFSKSIAFGIGLNGDDLYCIEDYKNINLKGIPWSYGQMIQVSYDGYNNILCCLTASNKLYYANTNITTTPNWTLLQGALFINICLLYTSPSPRD